jgi:hypothetical protein
MGREGTNERLSSRFARVRIHVGASNESGKSAQKWLLIEWPKDEDEPAKYWLSTPPRDISFRDLVDAISSNIVCAWTILKTLNVNSRKNPMGYMPETIAMIA